MKVCLGYIFCDGERWLRQTLPLVAGVLDGIVAVETGGSDRSAELLAGEGAIVTRQLLNNDFAAARNCCIQVARELGYDWLLMLDCDEAMFRDELAGVREEMQDTTKDVLTFARYNLAKETCDYWMPALFPDHQTRGIRLASQACFQNQLHETVYIGEHPVFATGEYTLSRFCIYHYGYCDPVDTIWLRHENYRRLLVGEPRLEQVPRGFIPPQTIYDGAQPWERPHPLR